MIMMHAQEFEFRHRDGNPLGPQIVCSKCEAPINGMRMEHDPSCQALTPPRAAWPDGAAFLGWERLQEAIGTAAGAAEHAADVAAEFGSRVSTPGPVYSYTAPEGVTSMKTGAEGSCEDCGASEYLVTAYAKADGPRTRCMDSDGCRRRQGARRLAGTSDAMVRQLIAVADGHSEDDDDGAARMQAVYGVLQQYGAVTG
jgi:hypothetical protein